MIAKWNDRIEITVPDDHLALLLNADIEDDGSGDNLHELLDVNLADFNQPGNDVMSDRPEITVQWERIDHSDNSSTEVAVFSGDVVAIGVFLSLDSMERVGLL